MLQYAHFRLFRHAPVWLLAIGLFAMAMQALGGVGIVARHSAGGGFQAEICTSKGVSKADPASPSGQTTLPGADHQDCCKLCVTGAPVLHGDAALGVPPAPTFTIAPSSSICARPTFAARTAHPPRGPPAHA